MTTIAIVVAVAALIIGLISTHQYTRWSNEQYQGEPFISGYICGMLSILIPAIAFFIALVAQVSE